MRLDSVSKSFGELEVLRDVSFSVEEGEFVSLVGPSGAGKSTIFNIIAGLDTPTSGQLLIDGSVAYMPQHDALFPWRTIEQNTALGLEVQGVGRRQAVARARELFGEFGLAGFEQAYPFELSGGMRQRAALLRTVVQGKDMLLLDEPFGALDSLTRRGMQEWLKGMWAKHNWTALLITHDVREAIELSDRIVVLSPRPATVRAEFEVGGDPLALERKVLQELGDVPDLAP